MLLGVRRLITLLFFQNPKKGINYGYKLDERFKRFGYLRTT